MAKGRFVDPRVVSQVRQLLNENEKLTGFQLQLKVESILPEFHYTVRTYQKLKENSAEVLARIKDTHHDEPWTIGSYAINGFDPEDEIGFEQRFKLSARDIEAILRVRRMQLNSTKIVKDKMSVRQALWISRLYDIVDQIHADKSEAEKAEWLWHYSFQYAVREKLARLNNMPFNTRALDDALALGHDKFKQTYEADVRAHWTDYERFYTSHMVESEYKHLKDGAR